MSSRFISESEIAEQRKLRQEEWERVRKPDEPAEAPEEPYDSRCLFDRLQEQKLKRDAEYEEAHKLKNMIKGLNDDEVEFLDLIDRNKSEEERKKQIEEEKEMKDFKAAVALLQEKSLDERLKQELKNPPVSSKSISSGSGRSSRSKLLAGVVVKKPIKTEKTASNMSSKRKHSEIEDEEEKKVEDPKEETANSNESEVIVSDPKLAGMKCIGILPGVGDYGNSSDSDNSSNSDDDLDDLHGKKNVLYDMLGRQIINISNDLEFKDKMKSTSHPKYQNQS